MLRFPPPLLPATNRFLLFSQDCFVFSPAEPPAVTGEPLCHRIDQILTSYPQKVCFSRLSVPSIEIYNRDRGTSSYPFHFIVDIVDLRLKPIFLQQSVHMAYFAKVLENLSRIGFLQTLFTKTLEVGSIIMLVPLCLQAWNLCAFLIEMVKIGIIEWKKLYIFIPLSEFHLQNY
ncbi:hypothetical protein O6P43_030621 [Quillaja saponaria]|uniref:Uncharacterized protein n=1 Tax=Quillaja saponaria TaxID=32244 RepID=A0AAD7KU11_QUISA|nr:hypothetical protein O6P43_030621 [Quillaja saponaria]